MKCVDATGTTIGRGGHGGEQHEAQLIHHHLLMDVDRLTMKRPAVHLVTTTRTLIGSFIERSFESDSDECGVRGASRSDMTL